MCIRAVDRNPSTIKHVPEFVPDRYKTQKTISKTPFELKYCPDKYVTQKMCDEVVDDFLPALNFVLD